MSSSKVYWPFDTVAEEEATPHHRAQIAFFRQATERGLRSYAIWPYVVGAEASDGRQGDIVERGRSLWEVVRIGNGPLTNREWVTSFQVGAEIALSWLAREAT